VEQRLNNLIKAIILEKEREKAIDKEFWDTFQSDMEGRYVVVAVLSVLILFLWVSFCVIIPIFKMYILPFLLK